jgi:hypothetical protein
MTGQLDDASTTADSREAAADERDRIADERDYLADERDDACTDREVDIESIFAAAEVRDDRADARDMSADQRDMAANLDAFIREVDDTAAFKAREFARRDRLRSKADRVSSELDRYLLTDVGPSTSQREAGLNIRIAAAVDRLDADAARQQAAGTRAEHARSRRSVPPLN